MEDAIALAAYVIIFVIIGGASVLKKILGEKKRQQALEVRRKVKTQAHLKEEKPRGLRPELVKKPEPAPVAPVRTEPDERVEEEKEEFFAEEEEEEKPKDIEDVLRRALGIPTARPEPPRPKVRPPEPVIQPVIEPKPVKELIPEEPLKPTPPYEIMPSSPSGWSEFIQSLEACDLSSVAQGIVLSEILGPPLALRRSGQFWKRGRPFG